MSATVPDISLRELVLLDTIAREGGFSNAGRRLGLTRTAVSRSVARLESQLGVRLFKRTTRRVVLTEPAERLVSDLGGLLPALRGALDDAGAETARLSGLVRISVSHAFGRLVLLPSILRFTASHPGVEVDVQLNDRVDDLVGEAIDLALRIGPVPESSLVARRLGALAVLAVASPALTKRHGKPATLDELRRFPVVAFRLPGTRSFFSWTEEGATSRRRAMPSGAPVRVDSIEAVVDLARAGAGVALVPRYLVEDDLRRGSLEPVLARVPFRGPDVHLCFVERRLMARRIRAIVDHLLAELPPQLWSERPPRRRGR